MITISSNKLRANRSIARYVQYIIYIYNISIERGNAKFPLNKYIAAIVTHTIESHVHKLMEIYIYICNNRDIIYVIIRDHDNILH